MIRFTRVLGYMLSAVGVLALLFWMIRPLRAVWPFLLALPWPIRLGLGTLFLGFLLIMASLIAERIDESGADEALRQH